RARARSPRRSASRPSASRGRRRPTISRTTTSRSEASPPSSSPHQGPPRAGPGRVGAMHRPARPAIPRATPGLPLVRRPTATRVRIRNQLDGSPTVDRTAIGRQPRLSYNPRFACHRRAPVSGSSRRLPRLPPHRGQAGPATRLPPPCPRSSCVPTWLVTGGAGVIGGNFVLEAVASGVRVVNLDALTYAGNLDTLSSLQDNPGHVFVEGDIGDRDLVARLLAEHRPDAVVNFAAESHVDRSIDGPGAFVQTNVVGTLALLEATRDYWKSLEGEAKDAFRFLHVSTDEVYGSLGDTGKF